MVSGRDGRCVRIVAFGPASLGLSIHLRVVWKFFVSTSYYGRQIPVLPELSDSRRRYGPIGLGADEGSSAWRSTDKPSRCAYSDLDEFRWNSGASYRCR